MSKIVVNDKVMQTTHKTVALVLNELGLSQGEYVVEVNGTIADTANLHNIFIKEGMVIQVVHPSDDDD